MLLEEVRCGLAISGQGILPGWRGSAPIELLEVKALPILDKSIVESFSPPDSVCFGRFWAGVA
jgi:hypothetical protein